MAGEDDFQNVVEHYEGELDREDAPPPKRERAAPAKVAKEELFPDREVSGEEQGGGDDEPLEDEEDEPTRKAAVDDEDEAEEDKPEAEDEEEEEPQETAFDLNQIVRVNIDGQPQEVSLAEALNGYVRTETFHRRLNQLGQVASEIEAERAQITNARAYYAQMIPALQKQLASLQPAEPDWDKLYAEDAGEAARLERQWRTYREKLGQLQTEHQRVQQEQQRETARRMAAYEDTQRRSLAGQFPQWSDNKVWERDRRSMIRTATAVGYSEAEIGELRDARATQILWESSQYRKIMAAKPKAVKQQGAMRPGATSSRAAPNGAYRADRRLQRTGSVRDAARAFEVDLDRER